MNRTIAMPAPSPRAMARVPVKTLPVLAINATDAALSASPLERGDLHQIENHVEHGDSGTEREDPADQHDGGDRLVPDDGHSEQDNHGSGHSGRPVLAQAPTHADVTNKTPHEATHKTGNQGSRRSGQ